MFLFTVKACFDASSYQGSEVNLFHTTSQVNNTSTTRHLNRPKSSPARAIAERNHKVVSYIAHEGLQHTIIIIGYS